MIANPLLNAEVGTDSLADAIDEIDRQVKTDKNTAAAEKAISQARVDLVLGRDAKAVFFATVAMRLRVSIETTIETAATDGTSIFYNPNFVAELTRAEMLFLIAHEVMHVTNAHHARMGDRDARLWNFAADLAINWILREAGFTPIKGACFPGEGPFAGKEFKPNLSAEEYYPLVRKLAKKGGGGTGGDGLGPAGNDPGGCGGVRKPGDGSPAACAKAEAQAREMAAAGQQAATAAGRGDLPGGLGINVKAGLAPKVPGLYESLEQFVSRNAKSDYSWTRPNRRYISSGIYLPGLSGEELGRLILLIDVSGSTLYDPSLLKKFAGIVNAVAEKYNCEIVAIYHDTSVQKVVEWKASDGPFVIETPGGGGTSHIPAFKHVAENDLMSDSACIVALTDLDSTFPKDPGYPVLWVAPRGSNAPAWGKCVRIED